MQPPGLMWEQAWWRSLKGLTGTAAPLYPPLRIRGALWKNKTFIGRSWRGRAASTKSQRGKQEEEQKHPQLLQLLTQEASSPDCSSCHLFHLSSCNLTVAEGFSEGGIKRRLQPLQPKQFELELMKQPNIKKLKTIILHFMWPSHENEG